LGGTIGQPDEGTLTGGAFTLSGGFWAGSGSSSPATQLRPLSAADQHINPEHGAQRQCTAPQPFPFSHRKLSILIAFSQLRLICIYKK